MTSSCSLKKESSPIRLHIEMDKNSIQHNQRDSLLQNIVSTHWLQGAGDFREISVRGGGWEICGLHGGIAFREA